MAKNTVPQAATDSPWPAARYVRRSAEAIRSRDARIGRATGVLDSERIALCEWAVKNSRRLPFDFIEQFTYIGSGAEHRVYYDRNLNVAIKGTRTNAFGHSVYAEWRQATPGEYLRRLAWCNLLFGDDFRIIGVAYDDELQIEIVCSQPWIEAHPKRSVPFANEIEKYFRDFGFLRVAIYGPDAPLFYNRELNLLVADAHDTNILRDVNGNLAAIDIAIGRPGSDLLKKIFNQFGWSAPSMRRPSRFRVIRLAKLFSWVSRRAS